MDGTESNRKEKKERNGEKAGKCSVYGRRKSVAGHTIKSKVCADKANVGACTHENRRSGT